MTFRQPLIDKILAGEKTVTRRPVKVEQESRSIRRELPCRYEVGKTYAVQPGRGKKAVARIRITHVRREPLDAARRWSASEAHREGFKSWNAFMDYWTALYGSYDPTQLVDRIEFELVEAGE